MEGRVYIATPPRPAVWALAMTVSTSIRPTPRLWLAAATARAGIQLHPGARSRTAPCPGRAHRSRSRARSRTRPRPHRTGAGKLDSRWFELPPNPARRDPQSPPPIAELLQRRDPSRLEGGHLGRIGPDVIERDELDRQGAGGAGGSDHAMKRDSQNVACLFAPGATSGGPTDGYGVILVVSTSL